MDEALKASGIDDKNNEAYVGSEVLTEVSSSAYSENIVTMYEYVSDAAIIDQQNEEYSESKVLHEGASSAPEEIDVDTSAHPEQNKDHDAEASAHHKLPEDVTEDNSVPVIEYRDEGNTHKTPDYSRTMYLDVANIDKNYKHIWRIIYKTIDAPSFGEVEIFPISFLNQY